MIFSPYTLHSGLFEEVDLFPVSLPFKTSGLQDQKQNQRHARALQSHQRCVNPPPITESIPLQNEREASRCFARMTNSFLDEAGNSDTSAPTIKIHASKVRYTR